MADMNESPALRYHAEPRPGKLSVVPTKPLATQADLSLAYTPGVAEPVEQIAKKPEDAYLYTNKGNLVAIISNGTAVLGLGNVGALASKPVLEGKAGLFKTCANIDVYDLEMNTADPEAFINAVAMMEPTFGAICLEDIRAPECFFIEEELRKRMNIPVFHDDQHGTATVVAAALQNALLLQGKTLATVRIVINGSGAAGIAIARLLTELGIPKANVILCDSKGPVTVSRQDLAEYKLPWAQTSDIADLTAAFTDADVCIGVSKGNTFTADMLKVMAAKPIVFGLANPVPEIAYDLAKATRPDAIVATGRSDFPNQINNLLCFPGLFRGLLDSRAPQVERRMLAAAASAIAALAHEPVPAETLSAYGLASLTFGPEYILPKPLDPRVAQRVAKAVSI